MPIYLPEDKPFSLEVEKEEYDWKMCWTHGARRKDNESLVNLTPSTKIISKFIDPSRICGTGPKIKSSEDGYNLRLFGLNFAVNNGHIYGALQTRLDIHGEDDLAILGYSITQLMTRATGLTSKCLIPPIHELKMSNKLARRIIDTLPDNVFVSGA